MTGYNWRVHNGHTWICFDNMDDACVFAWFCRYATCVQWFTNGEWHNLPWRHNGGMAHARVREMEE